MQSVRLNRIRPMFAHLHVRSWFSFLRGGSSPEALAARAAALGMEALALTDVNGVYGAIRFQKACRSLGIKPIFGSEIYLHGQPLVLLAAGSDGYTNLCRLLTRAHLRNRDSPEIDWDELAAHAGGLFCLTGTWNSHLWSLLDDGREDLAAAWVNRLHDVFGDRLSIEAAHHHHPGDSRRVRKLHRLSQTTGVPLVATGDVRYAVPDDCDRYDLLTCIRLGLTVFDLHPERPRNKQAFLQPASALEAFIPFPEAFERAAAIADACQVDLVPGYLTPPAARLAGSSSPYHRLEQLCTKQLLKRYPPQRRRQAAIQLKKELDVIRSLELEEFFLVVHEIVSEARRRGIRCAGRGSAANSIATYLLGITAVDPLAYNLLFERFLHGGRKGTPDIDVDFDSERREEVIAWMEERFGIEQTAMTATVVTYRLRSALRDAAKALGWPMEDVNRLSKVVPHRNARRVREYQTAIEHTLGESPLVEALLTLVEGMDECPRHLGLHVGGMVLSRTSLHHYSPIQVSANGVKVTQFDKDDTEALGLVKFDVLGLRMLATLSETVELIHRHIDPAFDLDAVPLDDVRTFNLIRAGKTIGVFQIESQGQLHLLAVHQPETFTDLINEISLFRPGPLQGNMVHPFIKRRRGEEEVTYDHPSLEPILKDTYGVILFQEQVLEIAHQFAGMSLEEADEFRRLMSKFRDPDEMEGMRALFVSGAVARGVPEPAAQDVFDKVSAYVGYGFCKSHAAAFAKTVYQSAYLKCHYPAPYLAAFMQHRPGMYSLMTLQEEARRIGITTLSPDVNRSGIRYDLERDARGKLCIRKPLTSITGFSVEDARRIVWERLARPFTSTEDLYTRVALDADKFRNLARSGALDEFAGNSRRALWEIGVLLRRARPGERPAHVLFEQPLLTEDDIPDLPPLTASERLSWDYQTHDAARLHPIVMLRRSLNELEIQPIERCYRLGRTIRFRYGGQPEVTVAGLCILRQRPPTAKGVLFITLEDETGFIQCVVQPHALEHLDHVLRSGALIVRGRLQIAGNWRGIVVTSAWPLNNIFGGYEGHLSYAGGRDRWIRSLEPANIEEN